MGRDGPMVQSRMVGIYIHSSSPSYLILAPILSVLLFIGFGLRPRCSSAPLADQLESAGGRRLPAIACEC